jgi:RNA-directed DNA polymerase
LAKRGPPTVNPLMRGWANYFRLAYVKGIFDELDAGVRRKLRCAQWRQWKRGRTRIKELVKQGLESQRARDSAFMNYSS